MKLLLEETAADATRGFEWYYWQRQMHLQVATLRGHTGPILAVAYSPDGQRIATSECRGGPPHDYGADGEPESVLSFARPVEAMLAAIQ